MAKNARSRMAPFLREALAGTPAQSLPPSAEAAEDREHAPRQGRADGDQRQVHAAVQEPAELAVAVEARQPAPEGHEAE